MKCTTGVSKSCFFCQIKANINFYYDNYRHITPFDADARYKYSNLCNLQFYCRRLDDMLPSLAQAIQIKAEFIAHEDLLSQALSEYLKWYFSIRYKSYNKKNELFIYINKTM